MKLQGSYFICTIILAILVLGAFFAPSVIIKMNDNTYLKSAILDAREGIDYEALNLQYEEDVRERLNHFVSGLIQEKEYNMVSSKKGENIADQEKLYQIYRLILEEMELSYKDKDVFDVEKITDWDYYVIYDDLMSGAAFLCWYLEFTTDRQMIRLLCDAKDYTVYYMELYTHQEKDDVNVLINKDVYINLYDIYYDLKNQNGERIYDIICDSGVLKLQVCLMDQEGTDYLYGISIGIKELADLLPDERKGTRIAYE